MAHVNISGQTLPKILAMVHEEDPDVLVVTEAKNAREQLAQIAVATGRTVIHPRQAQGPEAPDIAALVRNGLDLTIEHLLKMTETWWWRPTIDGDLRKREPKIHLPFVVAGWPTLAVHNVPASLGDSVRVGDRNVAAGSEFISAVLMWSTGRDRVLIVGDFNMSYAAVKELIAVPLGGRVISFGDGASHAVVVGGRKVDKTDLPEKPGQHGRAVCTIKASDA